MHNGIDFATIIGTTVYSNLSEKAVVSFKDFWVDTSGNNVVLDVTLDNGEILSIVYGHINPDPGIQVGMEIPAGSRVPLGQVGPYSVDGKSDPHLHLGVTNWSEWYDEVNKATDPSKDVIITYKNPLIYFKEDVSIMINGNFMTVYDLFKDQDYLTGDSTSLKSYSTHRDGTLIGH